ncbi:MAG: hypothetical protein O3A57_11390 [Bacteroidetes bacterium]|nr:hypothetical protein [Bacteroidota bacterium]
MRFLILALFCLSAHGQSSTTLSSQISDIDSKLEPLRHHFEVLRDSINLLESKKELLLRELAAAELSGKAGALVKTKQYTDLYDTPEQARSETRASSQEGIITEHRNGRFYFEGINGFKGWIGRDQFVFTQDASEYVESILQSGALAPDTPRWLEIAQSEYKQQLRSVELVLEEQRQADFLLEMIGKGIPLMLESVSFTVNSAGGVEPRIIFTNISTKTFKYVTITLQAFNAVADPARGRFNGSNEFSLSLVGPIEPSSSTLYNGDRNPPFYNNVTSCLAVTSIVIDYMDGGKFTMIKDLVTSRYSREHYNVAGECG